MVKQSNKGKPVKNAKPSPTINTGAKTTAKKGKGAGETDANVGASSKPAAQSPTTTLSPVKHEGVAEPSAPGALTTAELREAALHLLELAACRERAVAEDADAEGVLAIVCAKLLAHRRRRSQRFEEAASLNIAGDVAEVYRAVQSEALTTQEAEALIADVFAVHGLVLTDDGQAALDVDAEGIRDELGAVTAAKQAVGTVFGCSPRAMFYRESRQRTAQLPHRLDDPRLVQATAFGVRMGRLGLARYAASLFEAAGSISGELTVNEPGEGTGGPGSP